jgi:hypothetical protein
MVVLLSYTVSRGALPLKLCIQTLLDVLQSAKGNASFKAFKLSKAFLDAYKRRNFSAAR